MVDLLFAVTVRRDILALDEVGQSVRVDPDMLDRPWLRPLYDEPEFVVRNVWRLYGGWWDSDLAHLKPPCRDSPAIEVAALAGGAPALAARAATLADGGDLRLACQLIEWAHSAALSIACAPTRRPRSWPKASSALRESTNSAPPHDGQRDSRAVIDQAFYRDVLVSRVCAVDAVGPERQRGRLAPVGEVSGIVP